MAVGTTHQSSGSDTRSFCQSTSVSNAIIIGTSPALGKGSSMITGNSASTLSHTLLITVGVLNDIYYNIVEVEIVL